MDKEQQVMELWHRCFQDTEEFIRFYFQHKYKDEDSLVYEAEGKALAALQMIPYPMSWAGITVPTVYISGACTLPEARNRGIMTLLLQAAFIEMFKRRTAFSTLIPANDHLFDYYARIGYVPVFEYSSQYYFPAPEEKMSINIRTSVPESYQEQWAQALFPYFDHHMQKRTCCIQHPYEDFLAIIEELYMSGGRVIIAFRKNSGIPVGLVLALPEKEEVVVKEIFYESTEGKEALLVAIRKYFPNLPLLCKIPPHQLNTERLGMARIIDVHQVLEHMARLRPEISLSIHLNDIQLENNTGIYTLSGGQCLLSTKTSVETNIETDIATLTKALLGYQTELLPSSLAPLFTESRPYMNLMLE